MLSSGRLAPLTSLSLVPELGHTGHPDRGVWEIEGMELRKDEFQNRDLCTYGQHGSIRINDLCHIVTVQ